MAMNTKHLQIRYTGFRELEKHFVSSNPQILRGSVAGNSVETYLRYWTASRSVPFGDWLWEHYGARFVQIAGKRYLEFCTEEQLTLFLLKWQ